VSVFRDIQDMDAVLCVMLVGLTGVFVYVYMGLTQQMRSLRRSLRNSNRRVNVKLANIAEQVQNIPDADKTGSHSFSLPNPRQKMEERYALQNKSVMVNGQEVKLPTTQ